MIYIFDLYIVSICPFADIFTRGVEKYVFWTKSSVATIFMIFGRSLLAINLIQPGVCCTNAKDLAKYFLEHLKNVFKRKI